MKRVVLISSHPVSSRMAGPGIRYYKLAKNLSKHFEAILLIPGETDLRGEGFEMRRFSYGEWRNLKGRCDFLITQGYRIPLRVITSFNGRKIIDLYTPMPVEFREHLKGRSSALIKNFKYLKVLAKTYFLMREGDCFLCANERQVRFYQGMLLSWGIGEKPFLIVPSGIDDEVPSERDYLREKGIKKDDEAVFLWNGGLWRWMDPFTPVKGIGKLKERGLNAKLLFLGRRTPVREEKGVEVTYEVISEIERMKLSDRIFFRDEWTPFDESLKFAASSTACICTFYRTLEAEISFRTRFLDSLQVLTPVIWTDGDFFSELIKREKLGYVIQPMDVDGITEAMIALLDRKKRSEFCENIRKARERFLWKNVLSPLVEFISKS